jgi:hypothetical protein
MELLVDNIGKLHKTIQMLPAHITTILNLNNIDFSQIFGKVR